MRSGGRGGLRAAATALALLAPALAAHAQGALPKARPDVRGPDEAMLKQVRLDQRLGAAIPLDLRFRDESGREARLGDYFQGKPVMLMLIQFRCTMLCTEELNVLMDSLKRLAFTPGREFRLLIVSIDPRETPQLAADKKASHLEVYGRPEAASGWHFLTGEEASIRRLADAVGFHYVYDARTDQFAHPDGVIIATPEGRISSYFFRLEYPPRDLRYALIEAAGNRIGTPLDALALLCYHYNPAAGKYSIQFMKVLRLAGVATVLMLSLGVLMLRWRESRERRPADAGGRG